MGTALTQEQLAELSRAAPSIYLALDADSSGREAMLRASRAARDRGVELLVVDMPEGTDPAELVGGEGADAFARRLESAMSVAEFETKRVLAEADLDTSRGRDAALERLRPLIAATPERSAMRDELIGYVADRLDVPSDYVLTQTASPPRRAPTPEPAGPAPSMDTMLHAERAFLAMCVAQPELGREYLGRLGENHLSTDALRRARDWISEHFEAPLAGLPDDDPTLSAAVTDVVMRAEEEPFDEPVVRLGFLQLEWRRVERELRHAERAEEFDRVRALGRELDEVKRRFDEVMGQTV